MGSAPLAISLVLAFSTLLSSFIGGFAFGRAHLPGVRMFGFLLTAIAIYSVGYALEVHQRDLGALLLTVKFEYLGLAFIPAFWLMFGLNLTFGDRVPRWVSPVGFIIPVLTLIFVLTMESHSLMYQNLRIDHDGLFPGLVFDRGPWYLVNSLYQLVVPMAVMIMVIRHAFGRGRQHARQTVVIVSGSVIPLIVFILYLSHVIPPPIDPNPFAFTVTGILFSFALFRFGFLEVVPAARQVAMDAVSDAFFVFDARNRLQDINPAGRSLPGAERMRDGSPLPPQCLLGDGLRAAINVPGAEHEFTLENPHNVLRIYGATAYPVAGRQLFSRATTTVGNTVLVRDITDRSRQVSELKIRAEKDALTGLMNRRAILEIAKHSFENTEPTHPLSVVIIDLDHFKVVNDTFGHPAGDLVLQTFAELMQREVRSVDQCSRFGGEEFLIVLPDTDAPAAFQIAERLRAAIERKAILWDQTSITITGSFGIATREAPFNESLETIIAAADQALYTAKRSGRNRVEADS